MRQKGFVLLPVVIIVILLGVVGYFVYQYTQLQNNGGSLPSSSVVPTQNPPSPSSTPDLTTNWKRYQSTIGISFLKPEDTVVTEPKLSADLSITPKNNKIVNQEIIDGWNIISTYDSNQNDPNFLKNRAEQYKLNEEKNGCRVTPINKTLIGGKTAYNLSETDCFHFDASIYFVSSDSTYYEIRADYIGNVEEYKSVTDRIITSIIFTK